MDAFHTIIDLFNVVIHLSARDYMLDLVGLVVSVVLYAVVNGSHRGNL